MVLTSVEVTVQGMWWYQWLHVGDTHIYPCIYVTNLSNLKHRAHCFLPDIIILKSNEARCPYIL